MPREGTCSNYRNNVCARVCVYRIFEKDWWVAILKKYIVNFISLFSSKQISSHNETIIFVLYYIHTRIMKTADLHDFCVRR